MSQQLNELRIGESIEESDDLRQFDPIIEETDQISDPSAIGDTSDDINSFNSFMEFLSAPISSDKKQIDP